MIYFRVPSKLDSLRVNANSNIRFVGGELLTQKQCEKSKIDYSLLEKQEISKSNIFWFFGCRFEQGKGYRHFNELNKTI